MTINDFITYWGDSSNYRCVNTSGIEITGHVLPIRDIYDAANGTDTAKQLRLEDVAWLVENWQRVLNIMTQGETSPRITISPALTATHLESVRAFLNDALNNVPVQNNRIRLTSCSKIADADNSVLMHASSDNGWFVYERLLTEHGMTCDYLRAFNQCVSIDTVRRLFYAIGKISDVIGQYFLWTPDSEGEGTFYSATGVQMHDWSGGSGVKGVPGEGSSFVPAPFSVNRYSPFTCDIDFVYTDFKQYTVADAPSTFSLHNSFYDIVKIATIYVPYVFRVAQSKYDPVTVDNVWVQSSCDYVSSYDCRPVFAFPSYINDTRDACQFCISPSQCISVHLWTAFDLAIELNLRNDFAGIGWAYTPS